MASFTEIAAKIAKLFVATDKYHAIVNGPDNATVVVDSGVLPTFAKTIKDFNANLPSFGNRSILFVSKMQSATDNRAGLSNYNSFKPFRTIQAAIGAAINGEMVIVVDGNFPENIVLKNGVDLYFSEFSLLQTDGTNYDDTGLWVGSNVAAGIYGRGTFYHTARANNTYFLRQQGTNANLKCFYGKKVTVDINDENTDPYRGAAFAFIHSGVSASMRDLPIEVDEIVMKREHTADQVLLYNNSTNTNVVLTADLINLPSPLYSGYSYGTFVYVGGTTCRATFHIKKFDCNQIASTLFSAQGGGKIRYFGDEFKVADAQSGSAFYTNSTSTAFIQIGMVDIYAAYDNGYSVMAAYNSSKFSLNVNHGRLRHGCCIAQAETSGFTSTSGYFWVEQGPSGLTSGIRSSGNGQNFLRRLSIDMNDVYGAALKMTVGGSNYSFYPQSFFTNAQVELGGGTAQGGGTFVSGWQFWVEDWNL